MKMNQFEMDAARNAVRALGIIPGENDEEFYVGRAAYARQQGKQHQQSVTTA
jgi:hypothetical protein